MNLTLLDQHTTVYIMIYDYLKQLSKSGLQNISVIESLEYSRIFTLDLFSTKRLLHCD